MPSTETLAELCRRLVLELREAARESAPNAPPHAGPAPATLQDHLLTTAALIACLAYDHPRRDALRLAALCHEQPEAEWPAELAGDASATQWARALREQGAALDQGQAPEPPDDADELLLTLAHLAASQRLPIGAKAEFANHPLAGDLQVDLVYGGATRIKQYVFESARLPEIRGASALLDHINRLDLPALWGLPPEMPSDLRLARYHAARAWFADHFGQAALDAPECVLYASGGNLLALAPAGQGALLAQAIERRYTEVTQVAQSVAVSESVSLLELQYGRQPQRFWLDDLPAVSSWPDALKLIEQSCGTRDPALIFGADSLGQDGVVAARKGFGELVTLLAAKADRRRAGDGAGTGAPRFPVFLDLLSAARRCSSCDVRPAERIVPPPTDISLCEACRRKRAAGIWAKKGLPARLALPEAGTPAGSAAITEYAWLQSWGDWLEWQAHVVVRATVDDLQELATFARGAARGFVGLVYADGNNVGAHVAGLSSIAAYRRFAQQMLDANERAVALALIEHLGPSERNKIWPFEIITIGGDDVLLFVPADLAPAVAATIADEFGEQMKRHGTQITLSAGVLLMADHTPVRFARDLVEALLKNAKQRLKEDGNAADKDVAQRTTIDFMALKAASMVSETIGAYRRAAYSRVRKRTRGERTRETRLQLTQRPYTLERFQKLIDAGRALDRGDFPRSQLHQLAEIVGEGQQLRASIDYHYYLGRGRGRSAAAYETFENVIGELCGSKDSAPWRQTRDAPERLDFDTPLLDLVEILPFVGRAEREERA